MQFSVCLKMNYHFITEKDAYIIFWVTPTHEKYGHKLPAFYRKKFIVLLSGINFAKTYESDIKMGYKLPISHARHTTDILFDKKFVLEGSFETSNHINIYHKWPSFS